MLTPKENVLLSNYSTMRLGGPAKYLLEIDSSEQIPEAANWAEINNQKVMMIGQGSNIVWRDEGFDGLILVNKIMGFEMQDQEYQAFATIGAGEPWDSVVARIVDTNLSGVEHLSLIPGTTGATPVQNVGAYGKEIADVLVCVQAYDTQSKQMQVIPKVECDFTYRKSRFNTTDKNRFFITSITIALEHGNPMPPFYPAIEMYFKENNVVEHTSKTVRQAVISIRNAKLPDPAKVANCGSFFANPIIDNYKLDQLIESYPGIPRWQVDSENTKISAAWMLEQLGLKGYHEPNTGMAIWDKQPLVFVNEKAQSTSALLAFRDAIIKRAEEKFGITLKQEPELI